MPEEKTTEEPKSQSWWTTLPGILTALAGLITALGGFYVALHQTGPTLEKDKDGHPAVTQSDGDKSNHRQKEAKDHGQYAVSFPAGDEIKVETTDGEVVYKILTAKVDRQAEGKLSLKLSISITNNTRFPEFLGDGNVRLLEDGAPRAPTIGTRNGGEIVDANSAKDMDFIWFVPDATESFEFMVVNQRFSLPGSTYKIPIDLKAAQP